MVQLTNASGVRTRNPVYSHDGKQIACITDETGEQEVAIYDATGKTERRIVTHQGHGWCFPPRLVARREASAGRGKACW